MNPYSAIALLVLHGVIVFSLASGCANTASCDPGQTVRNGLCLVSSSAPAPPEADSGTGDGSPPAACPVRTPLSSEFGADCVTDDDCACPSPVCAITDGQSRGYCTQIGCDADATRCPSDWICFDASVIDPSFPHVCAKGS